VILDFLAASSTLEVILSLLVPALLRVFPALLSCPLLLRFESREEAPMSDSGLVASLSFCFNRFGGGREIRRSRGVSIELTDKVDLAAGSIEDGRDRLNGARTLEVVGGWMVPVPGVGFLPELKLARGLDTRSVFGLRVVGPNCSEVEDSFSAY